jgi:tRNA(Arg) A34 adenosine deaminase TadA
MAQDLQQLALAIAEKSPCTKRKVGAVIVDAHDNVLATGFNYFPEGGSEFDDDGKTHPDVVHAEVAACKKLKKTDKPKKIIVTHDPCGNCRTSILAAGITYIEVASVFMKWDAKKTMYHLVPPVALRRLADVFTYGARKYKPKNYLQCKDKNQFVSAGMRHLEAYRVW